HTRHLPSFPTRRSSDLATDEPHRAGAGSELIEGAFAGRDHVGRAAKTEIVVGGENHDLSASLHLGACGLGRFQVVQALVDPVPLELLEFGVEPGGEAHAISRMILPAS